MLEGCVEHRQLGGIEILLTAVQKEHARAWPRRDLAGPQGDRIELQCRCDGFELRRGDAWSAGLDIFNDVRIDPELARAKTLAGSLGGDRGTDVLQHIQIIHAERRTTHHHEPPGARHWPRRSIVNGRRSGQWPFAVTSPCRVMTAMRSWRRAIASASSRGRPA